MVFTDPFEDRFLFLKGYNIYIIYIYILRSHFGSSLLGSRIRTPLLALALRVYEHTIPEEKAGTIFGLYLHTIPWTGARGLTRPALRAPAGTGFGKIGSNLDIHAGIVERLGSNQLKERLARPPTTGLEGDGRLGRRDL